MYQEWWNWGHQSSFSKPKQHKKIKAKPTIKTKPTKPDGLSW